MLRKVTLEDVKKYLYDVDECATLDADKIMAKEAFGAGGYRICVVFPDTLPIDGDGDILIPGDFGDNTLPASHMMFTELGVDATKAIITFQTGAVLPLEEGELFRFELKAPVDSTHALICVDWLQGAPPTASLDMVCEKLDAEFMYRREATDNFCGTDLWIMKKPACLTRQMEQMQYDIERAISDGDAYAATTPLVAPTYLTYMESLLPQLNSDKERYTLKPVDLLHTNLIRWSVGTKEPSTDLAAELTCDLNGVQQLMRIIALKQK